MPVDLVIIVWYFVGVICLIFFGPFLVFTLFKLILSPIANRNRNKKRDQEPNVLIQIRVSKSNEKGPLLAEQLFNTLHGSQKKIGLFGWLAGEEQTKFSLEIANIHNSIRFFVRVPRSLQKFVEGQFYSQYPDIEISEATDYVQNILEEPTAVQQISGTAVAELGMFWHGLFPIRRYADFEDKFTQEAIDPIAGITASIGKLDSGMDQAWVQVVLQPSPTTWQKYGWRLFGTYRDGYFVWPDRLQFWFHDFYMKYKNSTYHLAIYPVILLLKTVSRALLLKKESQGEANRTPDVTESTTNLKYWDLPTRKLSKNAYDVQVRLGYVPADGQIGSAQMRVKEIATSFTSFNLPSINGFVVKRWRYGHNAIRSYAQRRLTDSYTINVEELATIWHLPNVSVKTPSIWWVANKKLEAPNDLPNRQNTNGEFTSIGVTNFRGREDEFGLKIKDRRRHVYIIGKTGMGKSTLLENMILSDINAGKGVAVVDPHGDLAETILNYIPASRINDVILFDPADADNPVAFNMLETSDPSLHTVVASGLIGIFKKMFSESWGPRLEHILRNTILSLLWYPDATMLGIMRILVDPAYRAKVMEHIKDPMVKSFWETEFNVWPDRQRVEAVSPIQNKVGQFLSSPLIRNMLGQPKSSIDIRYAMDHKKIFICNLSKGKIGEDNSSLLGSMMITKFQLDAMSRANLPAEDRVDFYLYVDEFQNFATDSFATILSEARKYKLNLTMANQFIAQMPEEVRDAVFGNVGSIVSFQVGFDDADYLSEQFGGEDVLLPADLTTLPVGGVYLRLLVDNMPTPTFSARTYPPIEVPKDMEKTAKIVKSSRDRYAQKRAIVEEKINRWSETGKDAMIKAAQTAAKAQNPWAKPEIPWRHEKNKDEYEAVLKSVTPEAKLIPREEFENYGVPKDTNEHVFALPGENGKIVIIYSTVDMQGNVFFKKLATKMRAFEFDPKTKENKELKLKIFKDEKWQERVEEAVRKFVPKDKQIPAKKKPAEKTEDKKEPAEAPKK